ncbi:hypothetical protein [Salininema proteolyticum]|uniref:Uncharacterized protein n=1 Tax=Salininema proteolyticum TaxID=1607685 RepID=A0ABV8TYA8_9ACTN
MNGEPEIHEFRPGLVSGNGSVDSGPIFAAVYGTLTGGSALSDPDPYALFRDRSEAMGWLTEERDGGLWGMNDAGRGETGSGMAAWFQVGVDGSNVERTSVPIEPLLACAADVVSWMGDLDLDAVQVLVPTGLANGKVLASRRTPFAFDEIDVVDRDRMRATVDGGQAVDLSERGEAIADRLSDQNVFTAIATGAEASSRARTLPFDDSFWVGPPHRPAVLDGTLPEWSLAIVGWLAAIITDSVADCGVNTPIVVTVERR